MDVIAQATRRLPGALEQRSTRMAFFVAGFSTAAWAPLVPYTKNRLGIDDTRNAMGRLVARAARFGGMTLCRPSAE
jgi:hypothetical protein